MTNADFLADALAYIEAHLFDALSVNAIADAVGLSPYHFSRMFTARFGQSVIAYVRMRRMQDAARRLRDYSARFTGGALERTSFTFAASCFRPKGLGRKCRSSAFSSLRRKASSA